MPRALFSSVDGLIIASAAFHSCNEANSNPANQMAGIGAHELKPLGSSIWQIAR